ncbi:hypothetical protein T484DRAFT_1781217 [Baffinella frigidus]|nr:hypothetical protein T484DRAFT_1781217 [Cryptophyta sp. CCMP2293]
MSHVLDQLEPFANGSRGDIAPEDAVFMMNRLKQGTRKTLPGAEQKRLEGLMAALGAVVEAGMDELSSK